MLDHIRVFHDPDDDEADSPVIVELYDPNDHEDSPPCAEMQMSDEDAHMLEQALNKERLKVLGLEETLVRVENVQPGDIIADLGFTVDFTETGPWGTVLSNHDDGMGTITLKNTLEIKVNRRVGGAVVEQLHQDAPLANAKPVTCKKCGKHITRSGAGRWLLAGLMGHPGSAFCEGGDHEPDEQVSAADAAIPPSEDEIILMDFIRQQMPLVNGGSVTATKEVLDARTSLREMRDRARSSGHNGTAARIQAFLDEKVES